MPTPMPQSRSTVIDLLRAIRRGTRTSGTRSTLREVG